MRERLEEIARVNTAKERRDHHDHPSWRGFPRMSEIPAVVWLGTAVSLAYAAWEGFQSYLNNGQWLEAISEFSTYLFFGLLLLSGIRFFNWLYLLIAVAGLIESLVRFYMSLTIFHEWDRSVFLYHAMPSQIPVLIGLLLVISPSARRHFTILVTLKGLKRKD